MLGAPVFVHRLRGPNIMQGARSRSCIWQVDMPMLCAWLYTKGLDGFDHSPATSTSPSSKQATTPTDTSSILFLTNDLYHTSQDSRMTSFLSRLRQSFLRFSVRQRDLQVKWQYLAFQCISRSSTLPRQTKRQRASTYASRRCHRVANALPISFSLTVWHPFCNTYICFPHPLRLPAATLFCALPSPIDPLALSSTCHTHQQTHFSQYHPGESRH